MASHRASTNSYVFNFPRSIADVDELQLTFFQNNSIILEKTLSEVTISEDGQTVSYTMTQQEANLFSYGKAHVQFRIREDDVVTPSNIMDIQIYDVLHDNILGE